MRSKGWMLFVVVSFLVALCGPSGAQQETTKHSSGESSAVNAQLLEQRGEYHERVGLILIAIGVPITLIGGIVGGYYLLQVTRMESDAGSGAIAGACVGGAGFLVTLTGVGFLAGGAVERRRAKKLGLLTVAPSFGPHGGAISATFNF